MMNNMTQLISWFQLEYPQLVVDMKRATHHLTYMDKMELKEHKDIYLNGKFQGIPSYSQQAYNLNPYHLESDVFTHTMMVCKQAENTSYEVKLAALLHDIGKPSTRKVNPKNGRVSFFNHDAVSAFMSLEILKREELGLTKKQQAHIFNLIALHTQIYKLTNEQIAAIGDIDLIINLIELGKADHAGRFHTEGDAVIPSIIDISMQEPVKRVTDKEVIILVGLPNGGKSTYVKEQKQTNPEYFVVSRDAIINRTFPELEYNEAWDACDQQEVNNELEMCYNEAKNQDSVIVDMTHMSKKSRRRSLSHFGKGYKKKCVIFLPELNIIFDRNSKRQGKSIPIEVIEKMISSFYPPTMQEFDEIEYVL